MDGHASLLSVNQDGNIDEVFLTIKGGRHYLWRAVDRDGRILDILVQSRRNKQAAKKFFRKLLKGCRYAPWVIITDQLNSYGSATREMLPGVEHRQYRYLNNRAENSHQPTRQRERRIGRFKSPGHAQHFQIWQEITGAAIALRVERRIVCPLLRLAMASAPIS